MDIITSTLNCELKDKREHKSPFNVITSYGNLFFDLCCLISMKIILQTKKAQSSKPP